MHIFRGKLSLRGQSFFADDEGFTIIFLTSVTVGEPVFVCWQWTGSQDEDGGLTEAKTTATQAGFIDSLYTDRDGLPRIGFCHGKDYSFDAVGTGGRNDFTSLSVTTKEESSDILCDPLSYVDRAASFTESPLAGLTWVIYLGNLSYQESVQNELCVVVLPDRFGVGDPVCTYWQCKDGEGKTNFNLRCALDESDALSEGQRIKFSSEDSHIFSGTISGTRKDLNMTMKFDNSTTSSISMIQAFAVVERLPALNVQLAPSIDVLSTVCNNTERVIIVSIYSSGGAESLKNVVLGGLGLFLTVLGVPFLTVGFATGLYLTSVVFGVAVILDTATGSGEAVTDIILFPGQSTFRLIPGLTWLNNDMSVTLLDIDGSGDLVLQSAYKESLGTAAYNLQDYMPGSSQALPYQERVRIGLNPETPLQLEYVALVAIKGFQPNTVGTESVYNPIRLQEVSTNMMLVSGNDGKTLKDYGEWTLSTGLKWDGSSNFLYMASANLGFITIRSLPELYRSVLKVPLYKVTSDINYLIPDIQTEDQALQQIALRAKPGMTSPPIRVASWNKTTGVLTDHGAEGEKGHMTVEYDSAESPLVVYLLTAAVRPFQRMVPKQLNYQAVSQASEDYTCGIDASTKNLLGVSVLDYLYPQNQTYIFYWNADSQTLSYLLKMNLAGGTRPQSPPTSKTPRLHLLELIHLFYPDNKKSRVLRELIMHPFDSIWAYGSLGSAVPKLHEQSGLFIKAPLLLLQSQRLGGM
ncbi:uncharacterized protein BDR25DRAFT_364052 [Lindgomyces ingoldianus]|uniref:Uncharacterized protein n=1 Tax=Lindgomyces ingoldianus TaxID=673940 RepID=A0ACB6Q6Q7_9PLEO|nr:uncharacterized protein BDR25DRAFT_364052 [Lindgomyces ingoldianus]KAF2462495.1 hypothetical protein BDR25DRAFT_364052 [Lindgomyces ingoldianus]